VLLNAVTKCWATSFKIDFTVLSFCVSWSAERDFFDHEEWIKKSHFTVTLTGQVFVISWTVAHLATVHKIKQMLRFISFICNTFLCAECFTKCCQNSTQCAALYIGCIAFSEH
jgi:hypothetical protein